MLIRRLTLSMNDMFSPLKPMALIINNPLNFIPKEYQQYLTLENSTADWKNIQELQELVDKIIQGERLHLSKDSKEYNLFCYRTAQMLMRHEAMKGGFCYQKHAGENNYSGSSVNEEKQVVVNTKEKTASSH